MPLSISNATAQDWFSALRLHWLECCAAHRALLVVVPLEYPAPVQAELLTEERERMTRYRFQRDKLAFALARHVTRKVLGADQPALAFSRHAKGKPFLPGFYPFNISHSGGLVAVAFAPPGPLGVDIEHMRHDSDVDDLVSVVCHSQERQFIAGITSKERVRSFYRCWTRKEALLKATGEGLRDDLSSIDVRLAETSPIINMGDQVRLIDVNVGWEGYSCSVAVPPNLSGLEVISPDGSRQFYIPLQTCS
ncbi:4'-phosphopantetheinyl transferase superfamily protein [Pseudovibrio sp. Tun.PSC04-5.I4]|uniref:4'-phosphopantetheinyl transferase family protein n=1 Tax=Pseudovibrio sp. Tun.PSC04-5.I4 TaxID=1798213 RepID=UPI000883830A|nr:4'-phosphopantetheinyl transferase superfamily protein [Pseudovibrio sp. Tun.PSC04-5.I4]SDQ31188.1 4'-phosphopantetheinyl transferase superfamily protein [Pseudovibrio sp. Tun.PSC04-5.I4]